MFSSLSPKSKSKLEFMFIITWQCNLADIPPSLPGDLVRLAVTDGGSGEFMLGG